MAAENDKLCQAVVCVRGVLIGTGFFIGKDGTLLTCFHVIGDKKTGEMAQSLNILFNKKEYPARCIYASPNPMNLDAAVLQLEEGQLPPGAAILPLGEWRSENK